LLGEEIRHAKSEIQAAFSDGGLPCSLIECDRLKSALLLDNVSNSLSEFRFSQ
jgi:hypothetical protein